jgi:hypothetical protein
MVRFTTILYWVYAALLVGVVILGVLSVAGVFDTGFDGPSL